MPLTINLHTESSIPLEVDTLQLETIRSLSADDIKRITIFRGNQQPECGEFFAVTGSAAEDNTVVWEGNCEKVKLIGTQLKSGTVRVNGNVGMHLGSEMTGGEIIVHGNAADWVGAEMAGGRIQIHGNAGHLAGSVYRGGRKGMTGGEILIHGNAGNELGHTMRRGLIAVAGSAGDAAGVGMIAGSIFIFGEAGIRYGASMKRGTIALFHQSEDQDILPTFKYSSTYQPLYLQLYLNHLKALGFPVPDDCFSATYRRYCGDFLELGKGEILTRELSV